MMAHEIRRATSDDARAIAVLLEREHASSPVSAIPFDPGSIHDLIERGVANGDRDVILTAISEGQVIGAIGMTLATFYFNSTKRMSVGVFWVVDPQWRGRGVGGDLLEMAISASRGLGAEFIAAQSVPGDGRDDVYRRRGFVAAETTWLGGA